MRRSRIATPARIVLPDQVSLLWVLARTNRRWTPPRSQQDKILDIISAYLAQHMRKAG